MISIGVTGWGDHDTLYEGAPKGRHKLVTYSQYFPIVELDSSFYSIPSETQIQRWIEETPAHFKFVVKAHATMTKQQSDLGSFESIEAMFETFQERIQPLFDAGKIAVVLFQFPPFFRCEKKNVDYIRFCRAQMKPHFPLAIEFRNRTWYEPFRDKTLPFIQSEGWIHTVCDEPQAGERSIGIEPYVTNEAAVLVRFHGRNVAGWNNTGQPNWREVRFLYRYNEEELQEWKERLVQLEKKAKHVYVLFNNNSGGDAADNALHMLQLLGNAPKVERVQQMDLFGL